MRLLLVLLSLNVYAQSVSIGLRSDVRGIVVDSLNNQLKVFFQDHYNTVNLTTYETKTFKFFYKKDRELAPNTSTTGLENLIIDNVVRVAPYFLINLKFISMGAMAFGVREIFSPIMI